MSPFLGHALLLVMFSYVLAGIVSGYRDDDREAILRGTHRRFFKFLGAVVVIAALSFAIGTSMAGQ